jgi:hypothetical protein
VLAQRSNPTSYQLLGEGLDTDIDDSWPGGLQGFVAWNLGHQPDLIAMNALEMSKGRWQSRLAAEYVQVGYAPGLYWLARRSLGPEELQAIRQDGQVVHAAVGP